MTTLLGFLYMYEPLNNNKTHVAISSQHENCEQIPIFFIMVSYIRIKCSYISKTMRDIKKFYHLFIFSRNFTKTNRNLPTHNRP